MKISIENFKSIKKLHQFDIKPFTLLSGVNSAGKSSFVQLLLLFKQTLELSSDKKVINEEGYYYSLKNLSDLFHAKNPDSKISFGLTFNKSEFAYIKFPELGVDDYEVNVSIAFIQSADKIIVSDFEVNMDYDEKEKEYALKLNIEEKGYYKIESDSLIYGKGLGLKKVVSSRIGFVAFFPLSYEVKIKGHDDQGNDLDIFDKKFFTIDWLKEVIDLVFSSISYIGPARMEPKEDYLIPKAHNDVGKSGEFVSQILKEQADLSVAFRRLVINDNGTKYNSDNTELIKAVKYWMCKVFDVADDIHSEKEDDSYRIFLTYKNGLKINIKHVGFGISQLLPIVVQGLIMRDDGILIVEQPEVHLHPKIQCSLFDFLYSLTLDGKKVIVETHSSHFITRMRRRIAEDESNDMDNRISLTFIEDNVFRTLEIDDYGTILNYYPNDFVEQPAEEMKAIVEAQLRKRSAND